MGPAGTPSRAAALVPPAWPSPACPRLIPLPQTLSLTPADKSHFQDGLIQFSTDFLLGSVTYGSPAGAGRHVTPQRPPSLQQLSTGCCRPPRLIGPVCTARTGGGTSCPSTALWGCCAASCLRSRSRGAGTAGLLGGGTQRCWPWYPGMLLVTPKDVSGAAGDVGAGTQRNAASGTQGCWWWYPKDADSAQGFRLVVPRDAGRGAQGCCWLCQWGYPGILISCTQGC